MPCSHSQEISHFPLQPGSRNYGVQGAPKLPQYNQPRFLPVWGPYLKTKCSKNHLEPVLLLLGDLKNHCGPGQCWANIMLLGHPSNKDICFSFVYQIRILYFYYFLILDILIEYQIFTFVIRSGYFCFQISIIYLLVSYQQIQILKIQKFACQLCWVLVFLFWGEKSPKGNIFLVKGNILWQIYIYI